MACPLVSCSENNHFLGRRVPLLLQLSSFGASGRQKFAESLISALYWPRECDQSPSDVI